MSSSDGARRLLPDRPSSEHLRKQAKRLAKRLHIQLAAAQRQLAVEYGFADWAALMAHVRGLTPARPLPPLAAAARAGDAALVERLIAEGHDPDEGEESSPLWEACSSAAPPQPAAAPGGPARQRRTGRAADGAWGETERGRHALGRDARRLGVACGKPGGARLP